jgi:translation elongation factor EF-4
LEDIIHASGKTGFGVENILAAIIENSTTIRRGGRAFTSFDI